MNKVVNYNKGKSDNSVAFVFSCPGSKEEKAKELVAGKTGENLECLLKLLNENKSEVFKYKKNMTIELQMHLIRSIIKSMMEKQKQVKLK